MKGDFVNEINCRRVILTIICVAKTAVIPAPWLWAKIKVKSCHHGVHRFLNCFKMFFLGRFHFNYPCTQVENPARMEGMEGYKSDHDLITCKAKVFNPAVHIQWDYVLRSKRENSAT